MTKPRIDPRFLRICDRVPALARLRHVARHLDRQQLELLVAVGERLLFGRQWPKGWMGNDAPIDEAVDAALEVLQSRLQ